MLLNNRIAAIQNKLTLFASSFCYSAEFAMTLESYFDGYNKSLYLLNENQIHNSIHYYYSQGKFPALCRYS